MAETTPPLTDRLRAGLARIIEEPAANWDEDTLSRLRRTVERTLIRLESDPPPPPSVFRFQITGGKPLLYQGNEALPLEADRLYRLLNNVDIRLQSDEPLDLDGGLASWLLRPEVTLIDTQLRSAEEAARKLKMLHGRDRDHAAAQAADSLRIRLRGRINQLIAALQAAHKESGDTAPLAIPERREETTLRERPTSMRPLPAGMEPVKQDTAVRVSPPPPPPPPPAPEKKESNTAVRTPPPPEPPPPPPAPSGPSPEVLEEQAWGQLLGKALRKILAAVEGSGFKAIVVGDLAHQSWASQLPVRNIELLVSSGEAQRETIIGAARGEGLQQRPGGGPLSLQYSEPKLTKRVAAIEIIEATTPFHRGVFALARRDLVAQAHAQVAGVEDLIVLRAGSTQPGDREYVVDLLVRCINRIDPGYLKKAASTAGVLDPLKSVWEEAKKRKP